MSPALILAGLAAAASAPYTDERFKAAVDGCVAAAPGGACAMRGMVRRILPRQPGHGHVVAYDMRRRALVWTITADPALTTAPASIAAPGAAAPAATSFWMLPILAADDAATGVGGRYTLAVPIRWVAGSAHAVATAPMSPAEADALVDHLALDIVFHAATPCGGCAVAGRLARTVPGPRGPMRLDHHFIFAAIDEIRFVDTRDGRVVGATDPREALR